MNTMKKIRTYGISLAALFAPLMCFATTKDLKALIGVIAGYLNDILALLMGAAVVMFVWYIIQYFIKPNEGGESRTEAAKYLMWSLIGFFVILSMWGLVNILIQTFNFGQNSPGSWANMSSIFPH